MSQPTRMLPIIFKLNNKDAVRDSVMIGFTMFNLLFLTEKSTAKSVLESIDIFTYQEFMLLNDRITNVRNREVGMNEKHLVIFYGVLHIIVKMLNSEQEVNLLNEGDDEEMNKFFSKEIQTFFLRTSNQFINEIKHDYTKNHYIARSIAKINAC